MNTSYNEQAAKDYEVELKTITDRIARARQEISDKEYQLKLLLDDQYKFLKSNCSFVKLYHITSDKRLETAIKMKKSGKDSEGNKLDRRKKYEELVAFEEFTNIIAHVLGISCLKSFEIVNIMSLNITDGIYVEFRYCDDKYELYIPNCDGVSRRSFDYNGETNFLAYITYYKEERIGEIIGKTSNVDKLKGIMAKAMVEANKGIMLF